MKNHNPGGIAVLRDVCLEIGMEEVRGRLGPCPVCAAETASRKDARGPIHLYTGEEDGLPRWSCHAEGCEAGGDAVSLIAWTLTEGPPPPRASKKWHTDPNLKRARKLAAGLDEASEPRGAASSAPSEAAGKRSWGHARPDPGRATAPVALDALRIRMTDFEAPAQRNTDGTAVVRTWGDLVAAVERPDPLPSGGKDALAAWTFAEYRDDSRAAGHETVRVHGLALDYDDEPNAGPELFRSAFGSWAYVAHTSSSHNVPKGGKAPISRWRVMLPYCRPVTPDEHARIAAWASHERRRAGVLGDELKQPGRMYYCPASTAGYAFHVNVDRVSVLDPDRIMAELADWELDERLDPYHLHGAIATLTDEVGGDAPKPQLFPWPGYVGQARTAQGGGDAALSVRGSYPVWSRFGGGVGSLWPGRLAVLVGMTGCGKSAWALQVAHAAAVEGFPVVYLSGEIAPREIAARLLIARCDPEVPAPLIGEILVGSTPAEQLSNATEALMAACQDFYVVDGRRKPAEIEQFVRDVVARHGRAPLLVVDYLQKFADGDELRTVVRALSESFRDIGTPTRDWPGAVVVALSTPARKMYEHLLTPSTLRKALLTEPMEAAGKESGEIEADAHLLMVMASTRATSNTTQESVVAVVKNRHGRRGNYRFEFNGARGSFAEGPADNQDEDDGDWTDNI